MVLTSHFERVHQRAHIDIPRHLGIALTNCREQSDEVKDGVDLVACYGRGVSDGIECVQHLERTLLAQTFAIAHIGCNHIVSAVDFAQVHGQFRTDLSACTDDKNTFHTFVARLALRLIVEWGACLTFCKALGTRPFQYKNTSKFSNLKISRRLFSGREPSFFARMKK